MVSPSIPSTESAATYWYFAIALFGAAMTPYEVFFFSSGAVEEHWTVKDLGTSRLKVLIGFPLGGILSVAIAAGATLVLLPAQIEVTSLSQVVMPVVDCPFFLHSTAHYKASAGIRLDRARLH